MVCNGRLLASGLLLTALATAGCFASLAAAAENAAAQTSIQAAIDQVGGTGGTVLVPGGTYMVDAVNKKRRLSLRSDMTLKLAKDATLKAIPNDSRKYSVLSISNASNVTVVGGTLEGDRTEHRGKAGEAGMGIRIDNGAKDVTISGVTSRKMWGDDFYAGLRRVEGRGKRR